VAGWLGGEWQVASDGRRVTAGRWRAGWAAAMTRTVCW
jgi:hypothetical protein